MSANDRQEGGDHYRKHKIQYWDAVKHWMSSDQYVGFLLGSAGKYLARFNDKDGAEGIKKAIHYLEKLLEFLKELDGVALTNASHPWSDKELIKDEPEPSSLEEVEIESEEDSPGGSGGAGPFNHPKWSEVVVESYYTNLKVGPEEGGEAVGGNGSGVAFFRGGGAGGGGAGGGGVGGGGAGHKTYPNYTYVGRNEKYNDTWSCKICNSIVDAPIGYPPAAFHDCKNGS